MVLSNRNTDMEAEGEHCPIRRRRLAQRTADHGGLAVVAVKKVGGAVVTAAAGMGVAVYGWAAVLVIMAALAAAVFVIWWVLSDSERSWRLKEILSAIFGPRV